LVIDVDPRNGGEESLATLQSGNELPRTIEVLTGGGGRHYYFEYPEGIEVKSGEILPGIDLLGDRHIAIMPPSLHMCGRQYRFRVSPQDARLVKVPDYILHPIRLRTNGARRIKTHAGGKIIEGERNVTLTQHCGYLQSKGAGLEDMLDLALMFNQKLCSPPLTEKEVYSIVKSISSYPGRETDFRGSTWAELQRTIAPISWAWSNWLPNGFLTIVLGD